MSGSACASGTATTVTFLLKWKMLQAILLDRSLSPAAKVVAALLLDRYNTKTHRCDPSYQTLSEDTGYTRRQVIRGASELRQQGWITASRGASKPATRISFHSKSITDLRSGVEKRRSSREVQRSAFARFLGLFDFRLLQQYRHKTNLILDETRVRTRG
ncbi:helix-turn-helix domain-containing protein [Bradyrhizobium sp. Ash2021]|uniref:helix-turn-helix domain-containing protein n=1 Tax=Bradyrhizobium sp. Ash2021 TaxID=2954771 RepID=UPI0035BFD543